MPSVESIRPIRVLFCLAGPNELNGPNVWLTRHLPRLRALGIDARLLYITSRPLVRCRFRDQIEVAGVPCRTVGLQRYTEDCVREVAAALAQEEPDVFVPNCFLPGYYAARLAREAGVSTVGVLHSDEPYYHDLVEVFVAGQPEWRLSGLVTVSKYLTHWVGECAPTEIVRTHAPYGVPLPGRSAQAPCGELRLVYCGRLIERQKRITRVVDRLAAAVRELPGVSAVLYGDGPASAEVARRIAHAELGSRLLSGGLVEEGQVMATLLQGHVFVLLSDFEGLSIALVEAMACGLVPIVARTRSGTDELLRDGENALLVDADDEAGFVAAVRRLAEQPEEWGRLSRAARQTVLDLGFTSDACAERWRDLCVRLRSGKLRPDCQRLACVAEVLLPRLPAGADGMRRGDRRSPRETIRLLADEQRPVYLWGAGGGGRAALPQLREAGVLVAGFIDSDPGKQGTVQEGLAVCAPEVVAARGSREQRAFVFVTSMYAEEITARLEKLGWQPMADFLKF